MNGMTYTIESQKFVDPRFTKPLGIVKFRVKKYRPRLNKIDC